ncbi:MAG: PGPGW domain-containing protein [Gemmatimonadota bacterium]
MKTQRGGVSGTIRASCRALKEGEPGRRFRDAHKQRRERRTSGEGEWPWAIAAVGALLVVGGLAIGWLPGPGGFISIVGVGLLATEFRTFAALLDRTEVALRRLWCRMWDEGSATGRALVVLGAVTFMAGAAVVAGRLFTR